MTARSGRRLKAADCKSFTNAEATSVPGARSERRSRGSIDLPASDSAVPPEARSARAAASKWLNTAGVDRPSSEKTATHHRDWSLGDDVPGSSCSMWSPRPRPRAIPPTRQAGTSAPSVRPKRSRSHCATGSDASAFIATRVAAASADPPAIPPATGSVL